MCLARAILGIIGNMSRSAPSCIVFEDGLSLGCWTDSWQVQTPILDTVQLTSLKKNRIIIISYHRNLERWHPAASDTVLLIPYHSNRIKLLDDR